MQGLVSCPVCHARAVYCALYMVLTTGAKCPLLTEQVP